MKDPSLGLKWLRMWYFTCGATVRSPSPEKPPESIIVCIKKKKLIIIIDGQHPSLFFIIKFDKSHLDIIPRFKPMLQ